MCQGLLLNAGRYKYRGGRQKMFLLLLNFQNEYFSFPEYKLQFSAKKKKKVHALRISDL